MFESNYQEFIYTRTYSRWQEELKRRETWSESVQRYMTFLTPRVPKSHLPKFLQIAGSISSLDVMPSMRLLWSAGPAAERDHLAGYNCAYLVIDSPRAFAELLYILMNGTGVGYSVESRYVNQLSGIPEEFENSDRVISFADSKRGWAEGYLKYLNALFKGTILKYDLTKIRPKGAPLKVTGGKASGPGPLEDLIKFTRDTIVHAAGRKLRPIECYDIACMVAGCVVVGGVRRSACIALSDLGDQEMSRAKMGQFPAIRSNTNISAAYDYRPAILDFLEEWRNLIINRSGERGIFNRVAADAAVLATGRREPGYTLGCNPCGEVSLRPNELCNLTEVVIRPQDTHKDLLHKVRQATILGVIQSTLTSFNFVSSSWRKNCEEERLLGVSLTGLMDHPVLNRVSREAKALLADMREEAIETAREWSEVMGIPMPAAITCVKPSGTVSQLVNSSSGIHARFSPYYIRRIEVAGTDPLAHMMIDQGVPYKAKSNGGDGYIFEFPIKSPKSSKTVPELTALQQLEYWKMVKVHWCEHNPSCTITVREHEWLAVGAWVYANWSSVAGITFYPAEGAVYHNPPYEEVDQETYNRLAASMPSIDFSKLSEYENKDTTEGAQEFACAAGGCEV